MTEKEFKLIDKKENVVFFGNQFHCYPEKDVKEFVEKLKEEFYQYVPRDDVDEIIEELTGFEEEKQNE